MRSSRHEDGQGECKLFRFCIINISSFMFKFLSSGKIFNTGLH